MQKFWQSWKIYTILSALIFMMTCGLVVYATTSLNTSSSFSDWKSSKIWNTLTATDWDVLMDKLAWLDNIVQWLDSTVQWLNNLDNIPAWAIMAFNLNNCPDWWKAYDKAAGRSIRGIWWATSYRIWETGWSDSVYIDVRNLPRHSHRMFTNDYNVDYNFDRTWNDNKKQRPIAVENDHEDGNGNFSYTMAAAKSDNKEPTIGRTSYVWWNIALDIDDPFVVLRYCEKL